MIDWWSDIVKFITSYCSQWIVDSESFHIDSTINDYIGPSFSVLNWKMV